MPEQKTFENDTNVTDETKKGGIFSVVLQYLKDLSFESPNAPRSLEARNVSPEISVDISVNAQELQEHKYEVSLAIQAKATEDTQTLFHAELLYGGIFQIENIAKEHIMPLLFIECPRLLFPFARKILADATQNGGFPPLMLDPVDFVTLFEQRLAKDQQEHSQLKPN